MGEPFSAIDQRTLPLPQPPARQAAVPQPSAAWRDLHAPEVRPRHDLSGSTERYQELERPKGSAEAGLTGAPGLGDLSAVEQCLLLVVEDDPNDYALLDRALRKARVSARVHWVQTAAEAVATLAGMELHAQHVCVVADVKLRGTNGFELVEMLRKTAGTDRLKIAFLTGRHDPVTQGRAYACGADAFFVKPNQSDDLVEIARALQRLASGHT